MSTVAQEPQEVFRTCQEQLGGTATLGVPECVSRRNRGGGSGECEFRAGRESAADQTQTLYVDVKEVTADIYRRFEKTSILQIS